MIIFQTLDNDHLKLSEKKIIAEKLQIKKTVKKTAHELFKKILFKINDHFLKQVTKLIDLINFLIS